MATRYPRKRLAQKRAREVLDRAGVSTPPVPVEEIARSLGLTIRYEPSDEEVSGALYLEEDSRIIGVNENHHPNRQRFTIAHELGHFLLHAKARDPQTVFFDPRFVWNRDANSSLAEHPDEIEANQFAANLLVPLDMLRVDVESGNYDVEDDQDVERLAKRYGVSLQALAIRLQLLTVFGD